MQLAFAPKEFRSKKLARNRTGDFSACWAKHSSCSSGCSRKNSSRPWPSGPISAWSSSGASGSSASASSERNPGMEPHQGGPPPKPFQAHYAILPELGFRTDLPKEKLRPALSELERLGLVTVSEERIVFATSLEATSGFDKAEFSAWASSYQSHRRRQVPLGRRMLGYLATGADDAKNLAHLFAAVSGISLRGAYYYARRSPLPLRWLVPVRLARGIRWGFRAVRSTPQGTLERGRVVSPARCQSVGHEPLRRAFQINPEWGIPEMGRRLGAARTPCGSAFGKAPRSGAIPAQLSPLPARISGPTVTPIREELNKESPNGTKNQDNNESRSPGPRNPGS